MPTNVRNHRIIIEKHYENIWYRYRCDTCNINGHWFGGSRLTEQNVEAARTEAYQHIIASNP